MYHDLEPGDGETLRTMRGIRGNDAQAVTGGHVEARAEGLLLILPDEHPAAATMAWPRAETRAWVALLALDAAARLGARANDGSVRVPPGTVRAIAEDIVAGERGKYLSVPMRDADAIVTAAQQQLCALGLLRIDPDGAWRLSPAAARYRNPTITAPAGDDSETEETGAQQGMFTGSPA
jgi:hypothetical protein